MTKTDVVRTRRLPFSFTKTVLDLRILTSEDGTTLFTYSPQLGVMFGVGSIDDAEPALFIPSTVHRFDASVDDLVRMQEEWEKAAKENDRLMGSLEYSHKSYFEPDAQLPFVAKLADKADFDLDELAAELRAKNPKPRIGRQEASR